MKGIEWLEVLYSLVVFSRSDSMACTIVVACSLGCTYFLGALIHDPRNCFGYETLLVNSIFETYLTVLSAMKDSTFSMLQKSSLTVCFFILCSLTWFHLIPRMFRMAWWKASRGIVYFVCH